MAWLIENELEARDVEVYAQACWDILLELEIEFGHCKTYDPLTIDEEKKIAHTYVFDLQDGGRHHPFDTLKKLGSSILVETVNRIKKFRPINTLKEE